MIGSAAKLGFMPFVTNLAPVIVVIMVVFVVTVRFVFRREFVPPQKPRPRS